MDPQREALLALSLLCEPGNRLVSTELTRRDATDTLQWLLADRAAPASIVARERLAGRSPADLVAEVLAAAHDCRARPITPLDDEWPSRVVDLAELFDETDHYTGPPLCLWARGPANLAEAVTRSVSIVGARTCTAYGRYAATELAYGLADRDWTVLSGGAYGIDAAAHRGALAAGGPTVCVLAGGIDHVYPSAHDRLFAQIADTGLLISEWPPGASPRRYRFLVRNRVVAALTLGTVVVEAGVRSGARYTARMAAELDRPVMVVPGPITSPASAGVHQLARGPAPVRLVTRAGEIIEDLGPFGTDADLAHRSPSRPRDRLSPDAVRILDSAPRRSAALPDRIAAQAGVPVEEARRILPGLAAQGFLEDHGGRYRLATDTPPTSRPPTDVVS